MKKSIERKKDREGKKATQKLENEDVADRNMSSSALSKVNVQRYLLVPSPKNTSEVGPLIAKILAELRPDGFDLVTETRDLWELCILNINKVYPVSPTREKPQDFTNNSNNINKFFGNKFGSTLRSFVNTLGIHFAGA